jgi:hypothetical protein
MSKIDDCDALARLWMIGIIIKGLGELVKFQSEDCRENAHFALGEILEELGDEITEIKDRLEGTHQFKNHSRVEVKDE